jgi:spore germination protein YaaH
MPNYESQDFHSYFELDPKELTVVLGGDRLGAYAGAMSRNGEIFLSTDFIAEYFDDTVFWDEKTSKLTVTTGSEVIRAKANELRYFVNDEPTDLAFPVLEENGEVWMPQSLSKILYPMSVEYVQRENIAVIDYLDRERSIASVSAATSNVRYKADKKALIEERLMQGEQVFVYGKEGDYTRVRTANGLLGYCLTRDLGEQESLAAVPAKESPEFPPLKSISGKISMVWDQVFSKEDNLNEERLVPIPGLDVISPTWFTFDVSEMNGDLVDIGDPAYVDWAHSQGWQVWALVSDFSSDLDTALNSHITQKILSDTDMRDYVIKQLLSFIDLYGLDGINVDFEYVQPEDARHYIQFFRELYPHMRAKGAVLSVDMYNPDLDNYWSKYYNREAVGACADYICVMAYDQSGSSPVPGPNASLPFVEAGLDQTLKEVPKEKVILGMPFYSRIWRTETIDDKDSSRNDAYGMEAAKAFFDSKNTGFAWDEVLKSYYAEYSSVENGNNVTYSVWLEDLQSLEEKLKVAKARDIAGISGWKRGLEAEGVWSLINSYAP